MHEIDLTPAEYRDRRLRSRWTKNAFLAALLVAAINTGAFGYFFYLKRGIESDIQTLQVRKEISNKQRIELTQLQARQDELGKQWQLLTDLRSGSAVEHIFQTVDNALAGDDIWFLDWTFRRAGAIAKQREEPTRTGYFIVVPAKKAGGKDETWRIDTHMTIRGEALDYSALSGFVARLIDQPEIDDVRVLRSTLKRNRGDRLVEFSLAVMVAGGLERS